VVESLRELPVEAEQGAAAEVELRLQSAGRQLLVVCTAGRIVGRDAHILGYVLLFDDVTDISRSQHLAAWRDVARRIAHEIKNPLTPLQLSAQRLEKLLQASDPTGAVAESTRSIVEHVEIIKRLANEFSEYGRMPTAQFVPTDLAALVSNVTRSFAADHNDILFSWAEESKLPEMLLDPQQIRGVLINVLSNAVSAVRAAQVQIADNGPGIPAQDKNRVFEPYFTTKKGGTGLGLAIVSSVVSDHQGEVRIFDNAPHGVRLVITLPQHPHATTVRKFGTGGSASH
jgi:two-component system nitrogen regulation sensor histidine kinase NtrY